MFNLLLQFSSNKKTLKLSTQRGSTSDKIQISEEQFWDIETLSILYAATEKTQKPFLNNAVRYFFEENQGFTKAKLVSGIGSAFYNVFSCNNSKESLTLMLKCLDVLGVSSDQIDNESRSVDHKDFWVWLKASWRFDTYCINNTYFDRAEVKSKINNERSLFESMISNLVNSCELSITDKLKIAVYCQMIYGISYGRVQYDHISPLMNRIESNSNWIDKIITVDISDSGWENINIVSLKNCNIDAKKTIPLLLCKSLYDRHKERSRQNETIDKTIHLIIDEAHNILSESSNRESESWKDYRLETFEEIIKEGRKFGVYLTIASQRPADISATIISQLHNNFIHRLVNEQDLRMIASSVSSLDSVSRSQLPMLAAGQCIISGTSFEMPLLIQIEPLEKGRAPKSESADLDNLWRIIARTE